jgi:DNA-directed RNA polymerase sigma subunit (sigma70/sigma32)
MFLFKTFKSSEVIDKRFINRTDFSYTLTNKEYYTPINIYLKQIKEVRKDYSLKNLSLDEEIELFKRVELNDLKAKEMIIYNFLPLVPRIVNYYVGNGASTEDLVQEGNLALISSIDTFDFRKGIRFSTHAKWRIRNAIWDSLPFYLTTYDMPVNG